MKGISGRQFCSILKGQGWELQRIHGSHHIFMRPGSNARISVPVHGNKTLKIGLQKHLMKVSGITEDDL